MAVRYIAQGQFAQFVADVTAGFELFGHQVREGEQPHMVRTKPEDITLGTARAVEPGKSFLYPPREDLGEYFAPERELADRPTALVGLTACDLRAFKVLDEVFLGGEFKDPYYEKRRQNLLVVSMDCTGPFDGCFCTFFGQPPYPAEGYDINISPLAGGSGGYLVEAGTEKGEKLLTAQSRQVEATAEQLAERDRQRKASAERVNGLVHDAGLGSIEGITEKLRKSKATGAEFWAKHANKCVECGACNFICPACHCFLLVDVERQGQFRRFKNWDSCLYLSFARVAGGANPRGRRVERLQNRFEKKFDFLISTMGLWGCTGCGRCTQACAGDIDIKEVLRDISKTEL